ncbi:MAG: Gfo/Idh/MocA family protein [bacterium]
MERPEIDYRIKLGKKTDYGIGIIGLGWVVQNYHLPTYKRAGFNVVAVADLKEDLVKKTQKEWGMKYGFTDYKELLKLKEVEIVDVSTQTFGRAQIAIDVARARKHIFSQKPFTRSYREGLKMVEAAERAGVKIAVNSHYRWLAGFRAAYKLLEAGYIGEPYFITVDMLGNQDHVYYNVMPERRWNAELDDFMQVEWGAHMFDFLRFWTGKEPKLIYSSGTRRPGQNFKGEMVYTFIVEFDGNLRATYTLNQTNNSDKGWFRFRIDGTEGVIEGQADRVECYSKKWDKRFAWDLEKDFKDVIYYSYIGTMGDLMNAITEGREHVSSGRDNLKTVKCYLAGVLSEKMKRPVSPEEIED